MPRYNLKPPYNKHNPAKLYRKRGSRSEITGKPNLSPKNKITDIPIINPPIVKSYNMRMVT